MKIENMNYKAAIIVIVGLISGFILFSINENKKQVADFTTPDIEMTTELDGESFVFINEKKYVFSTEKEAENFMKKVYELKEYTYNNVDALYKSQI